MPLLHAADVYASGERFQALPSILDPTLCDRPKRNELTCRRGRSFAFWPWRPSYRAYRRAGGGMAPTLCRGAGMLTYFSNVPSNPFAVESNFHFCEAAFWVTRSLRIPTLVRALFRGYCDLAARPRLKPNADQVPSQRGITTGASRDTRGQRRRDQGPCRHAGMVATKLPLRDRGSLACCAPRASRAP